MDDGQAADGRTTLHRLGGADGLPDLLLVHGFGSDRFSWAATAPAFFDTHRVWAAELPGHTAGPIRAGSGDPASMARSLAPVVAGRLAAPFAVIGHSLGGTVAAELASARPELVSRLVLIAPAGLGEPVDRAFLEAFPALDSEQSARRLLEMLVTRPRLISPQMVRHVLRFLGEPGRREALETIAGKIPADFRFCVPHPDVTVVWGASDRIIAPSSSRLHLLGLSAHVLEGAGHMPHVELARRTNTLIAEAIGIAPKG